MRRNEEEEVSDDDDDGVHFEFMKIDSARLKMFSDAVWAIIATIMIVPIMHNGISEKLEKGHDLADILHGLLPHLPIYFLAFLIVCSTWSCHVWTFQIMKHVTDLSIVTNLIVLLAASLLPYFYSVMSRFKTTTSVIIYSTLQVFIGLVQCLQILHGFGYEGLLKGNIERKSEEQKKTLRAKLLRRVLLIPIFGILAIILSFLSVTASLVCLTVLLFYPWIQSILRAILSRIPVCSELAGRKILSRDVILSERIKKTRLEGFSDGVFAITSTLLALDITEKRVPTVKVVNDHYDGHVRNALLDYWGIYVSYLLMFIIIGLLWFMQLTLFKNIMRFSRIMQFINNWSLACVGVIPLAFTFIVHFKVIDSVIMGMRIGSVAIFCVGFFFAMIYALAALFDKFNRAKNEKWLTLRVQPGGADFGVFLFQLTGLPVGSAIVFGLSFLENKYISIYTNIGIIVMYGIILILWKTIAECCLPHIENAREEFNIMDAEDEGELERLTAATNHD